MRDTHLRSAKTARWAQLMSVGLMSVGLMGLAITLAPSLAVSTAQASTPQGPQRSQPAASRPQISATHAVAPRGAVAARPASARPASARPASTRPASARPAATGRNVAAAPGKQGVQAAKSGKMRVARGGGLQCVPFARNASGIEVSGNAHTWWGNAAGTYARGQAPERGSVLSFQANRSMPLGHVAVVSHVINARTLEIDHANWAGPGGRKGSVARGVSVVDVSEGNDWSAVRVALGRGGEYGSIYPVNGFIYDRPDRGGVMAAARNPAPMPELNAPPRDLRPTGGLTGNGGATGYADATGNGGTMGYASVSFAGGPFEEVAEAAPTSRRATTPRRKVVRARH